MWFLGFYTISIKHIGTRFTYWDKWNHSITKYKVLDRILKFWRGTYILAHTFCFSKWSMVLKNYLILETYKWKIKILVHFHNVNDVITGKQDRLGILYSSSMYFENSKVFHGTLAKVLTLLCVLYCTTTWNPIYLVFYIRWALKLLAIKRLPNYFVPCTNAIGRSWYLENEF